MRFLIIDSIALITITSLECLVADSADSEQPPWIRMQQQSAAMAFMLGCFTCQRVNDDADARWLCPSPTSPQMELITKPLWEGGAGYFHWHVTCVIRLISPRDSMLVTCSPAHSLGTLFRATGRFEHSLAPVALSSLSMVQHCREEAGAAISTCAYLSCQADLGCSGELPHGRLPSPANVYSTLKQSPMFKTQQRT
jgi:hypothetical protein